MNVGAAGEALLAVGEAFTGGGCDGGYSCGMGLPAGSSLFSGGRGALREVLRTSWVEGLSGRQGLAILGRLTKGRVDDIAISAGEGGTVIARFTKLLEKGKEVTVRAYNTAGKELSTVREVYDEAGNLIRQGVIR